MGRATGLSATQLTALARLKPLAVAAGLHLVGGAALRAYAKKFGAAEPDLYPVLRSLTYFVDADAEPLMPAGLTEPQWERIKQDLQRLATSALDGFG